MALQSAGKSGAVTCCRAASAPASSTSTAGATWAGWIRSNRGRSSKSRSGLVMVFVRWRSTEASSSGAGGALGGLEGVDQQHGDGHGPDAARHRRDPAGHLAHPGEVDVAAKLAFFVAVHADVDHH